MDFIGDIVELLTFEIAHDDIIFMWGISDVEQNMEVTYY